MTATRARDGFPFHAAFLLVAITYAAFAQGAFFDDQLIVAQALIAAALIAAFVVVPPRRDDGALSATYATAAVIGAGLVTSAANHRMDDAVPQAIFVATLLAVVLVVRRIREPTRETMLMTIAAVGAVVALLGWYGVAFHASPAILKSLWRASTTITYANAAGSFLMMCSLVALARVIERSLIAAVLAYTCIVGLAATFSRGAAFAFAVGFVMLGFSAGWRRFLRAAWPTVFAAAIAVVGLLPSAPVTAQAHPVVATSALALGASVVCLPPLRRWLAPAAAIGGGGLILVSQQTLSASSRALLSTGSLSDRRLWRGFIGTALDHPVAGTGTRAFNQRYNGDHDAGRFAHNEYLQTFVEQGLVGLAIVVGALFVLAYDVLKSRRDDWLWRASAAALAGMLAHAALDFVWNVPLIPIVGAMLLAVAKEGVPCAPDSGSYRASSSASPSR